jgi:hypothetical protein
VAPAAGDDVHRIEVATCWGDQHGAVLQLSNVGRHHHQALHKAPTLYAHSVGRAFVTATLDTARTALGGLHLSSTRSGLRGGDSDDAGGWFVRSLQRCGAVIM